MKFGSSNTASVAARVCESFIPEMPFRVEILEPSQVPISQHGRASRSCDSLTPPSSSVDRGYATGGSSVSTDGTRSGTAERRRP